MFPENIVDIPLIRYPRDIKPYSKDLDTLSEGEQLPEIYMKRVDEPDDLKRLKAVFYDFIDSYKTRAEKMSFDERQVIYAQLQMVKKSIDEKIRELYPEVVTLAKKINDAGFLISHPEVNFGIRVDSNGTRHIVFYDIFPHIDISKLMNHVLTNTNVSESQRKAILRKLTYFKYLDAKGRDLIPVRDTVYKSITDEGKRYLTNILGVEISSADQMHKAVSDIYLNQLMNSPSNLRQVVNYGLNIGNIADNMNAKSVLIGKYRFSAGTFGDKILIYPNMDHELFATLTRTNIGLPIIEMSKDKNPSITLLDFNYLYDNKLINFEYR